LKEIYCERDYSIYSKKKMEKFLYLETKSGQLVFGNKGDQNKPVLLMNDVQINKLELEREHSNKKMVNYLYLRVTMEVD